MKICMCGKCAAKMGEKNPETKARKDTCQICGRRRFCAPYNVQAKHSAGCIIRGDVV